MDLKPTFTLTQQRNKNDIRNSAIVATRIQLLRDPRHMQQLAIALRDLATTANGVRDTMTFAILDFMTEGGSIVTAKDDELDLNRMETTDEPFVLNLAGSRIKLEQDMLLRRLDDSFGENTRRTLNRLFEKISTPNLQRVDRRLISLMFWADVALRIIALRQEESRRAAE